MGNTILAEEGHMFEPNGLMEAVMAGDGEKVSSLVQAALDQNVGAGDILSGGLIAAMDIVGEKMEKGDMFIPEVLMAAQAMNAGVKLLKPFLSEEEVFSKGKVIIGTVKGDLHDIGKNLVAMMLESAGLEVHNLGVDIEPDAFVEQIKKRQAGLLCLSALLTTTMPMMKATVDAITEAGLRDSIKIMVGGAPVTKAFADEIGADGYAPDAGSAAKMAKAFFST
jgi:5-methyltetrahydrofolate--homocysteine methyltransferase